MNKFLAIPVNQPIGEFYICSIPYNLLQKIAFPDPLTLVEIGHEKPGYYKLTGNQREEIIGRRKDIGRFISSAEATFPNSIILAANITEEGEILSDDEPNKKWRIEFDEDCKVHYLIIPSEDQLARIIDGQHRVRGFEFSDPKPSDFDLPCSIFLDLSMPEQASIFATINTNQKRVDRSLAFNLFSYNLENEEPKSWSPDKLAVFFTRRLNLEDTSPFKKKIKVIARQGKLAYSTEDWIISTSVMVDGICSLISKNPTKDRLDLSQIPKEKRERSLLLNDNSPLRSYYLQNNDLLIYKIILNYFSSVNNIILWNNKNRGALVKSIGIQALFEFLKIIVKTSIDSKDVSVEFYNNYFIKFENINFNNPIFSANAQGKQKIKNFLLYVCGLNPNINIDDKELYDSIIATSKNVDQNN